MPVRGPKFDAAEIAKYCCGKTVDDAVLAFGCSRATVINACSAHGVDLTSKAAETRGKIAQWVKDNNASVPEAASKFGTSRKRVGYACKEHGVTPRLAESDYSPPIARSTFEILCLLLQGHGGSEIAEEFGVSRQRVGQIKKRAVEAGIMGDDAVVVFSLKPSKGES